MATVSTSNEDLVGDNLASPGLAVHSGMWQRRQRNPSVGTGQEGVPGKRSTARWWRSKIVRRNHRRSVGTDRDICRMVIRASGRRVAPRAGHRGMGSHVRRRRPKVSCILGISTPRFFSLLAVSDRRMLRVCARCRLSDVFLLFLCRLLHPLLPVALLAVLLFALLVRLWTSWLLLRSSYRR